MFIFRSIFRSFGGFRIYIVKLLCKYIGVGELYFNNGIRDCNKGFYFLFNEAELIEYQNKI